MDQSYIQTAFSQDNNPGQYETVNWYFDISKEMEVHCRSAGYDCSPPRWLAHRTGRGTRSKIGYAVLSDRSRSTAEAAALMRPNVRPESRRCRQRRFISLPPIAPPDRPASDRPRQRARISSGIFSYPCQEATRRRHEPLLEKRKSGTMDFDSEDRATTRDESRHQDVEGSGRKSHGEDEAVKRVAEAMKA